MNLESMTVKSLKEEAAKRGVKLKSNAKKEEIIAAIKAVEPVHVVAEVIDPETDDGEVKPCKDLIVTFPAEISILDNITALDAYVEEQIAPYVGAKFDTADEKKVKEARQCMADLNNIKKPIEEERKRIKRTYEKPLKDFEARVKQITEKIDSARTQIKKQVDEADEAFKDDRRASLSEHYAEFAELLAPVVPYEMLHDPKWCNRTTAYSDAEAELEAKVGKIASDWEALKSLSLEFYDAAEAHFFRTLDLGSAVEYNTKLVSDREKINDLKSSMAPAEEEPETLPACYQPLETAVAQPVPAPVAQQPVAAPIPAPVAPPQPIGSPMPAAASKDVPKPRVMIVNAATIEQCRQIGRFCGSIGVTGKFVEGTLAEAFRRERALEMAKSEGVLSYV